MNGFLTVASIVLCVLLAALIPVLVSPSSVEVYGPVSTFDSSSAVLLCVALGGLAGLLIYRSGSDGPFLLKLFIAAVLIRMVIGAAIFIFNGQNFFGGDALTYDYYGYQQMLAWRGGRYAQSVANVYVGKGSALGWGMVYLVAAVYAFIGRNILAVQFVNSVLGAATAPIIFLCAQQVFNNTRVARFSAMAVAFYPSLVLWSSQGLKDGPIVFTLALSILATLKLGERLTVKYFVVLAFCLIALLSLRFYIFYMMVTAIVGAFVIGMRKLTTQSFVRHFLIVVGIGLAMTWFGVVRYAKPQFEQYGNLAAVQRSRGDLAQSAQSGFAKDVDVSTTEGALSTVPIGMVYLLLAPFPWQLNNLRQTITLPEMIVWWAAFPMLVLGLWFAIKYRLRQISPILIFTVMLSLAYSVFQGNVGTAYRQRAQLLVFYFIFVAVGLVLVKEKREERSRRNQEEAIEEWRRREDAKERKLKPQIPLSDDPGQRIEA